MRERTRDAIDKEDQRLVLCNTREEKGDGGGVTIGEEKTTFSFPFLQFLPLINGAT